METPSNPCGKPEKESIFKILEKLESRIGSLDRNNGNQFAKIENEFERVIPRLNKIESIIGIINEEKT